MTALKFLQTQQSSRFFVSGDSVGVVRVWEESSTGDVSAAAALSCRIAGKDLTSALSFLALQWSTCAVLTGHSQSVSALALMELPESQEQQTHILVVSGGSEGGIQTWSLAPSGPGQSFVLVDRV